MSRAIALALTIPTGFAGLVYQVAWQKVLATLLGSQAEATAAVLGLFLGGLAAGYALFGRLSRQRVERARAAGSRPHLLRLYGGVECGVGALALLFPWLFVALRDVSLRLPQTSPGLAFGLDVGLAGLLVLPPTLLMGATVPLLTQALARDVDDATYLHSMVYACNTLGAFAGALAAGFLLVPVLGLGGTLCTMGGVNLAAGLGYVLLDGRAPSTAPAVPAPTAAPRGAVGVAGFCAAALLAGFAMMTLQTALNRVGALALGASHFTFAMIVASFVLCIALGSFAVAALPRIPTALLALSQWLLVGCLVLLYPVVQDAPFWAQVLRLRVGSLGADLYTFSAAVFLALLCIALVPLALSGALLPLLFHHLRRESADLGRVAGHLYAWNTVGSLLGALLGGYALFFWLDLHAIYRVAVLALAAGAALLTVGTRVASPAAATALALAIALALGLQPAWEPRRLAAGLFRARLGPEAFANGPDAYFSSPASRWIGERALFHTDDPTTSVTVLESRVADGGAARSILVNGKVDGNVPSDDLTAGLLALLPALFAERAERAFVVGFGAGVTAGTLAKLDAMREVVVAEISSGVVAGGRFFEEMNGGALSRPEVHVVRGDAYRTLLRDRSRYDLIVSEPSNPWVAGVEMLYSIEFLRAARERLAPGGVFAQWFHTYETDDATVELVLRTYREAFGSVGVWAAAGSDLVILGFAQPRREPDLEALARRARRPDFARLLAGLEVDTLPALLAHEVLPLGVLHAMALRDPVHRLLEPRLADAAARAFYRHREGSVPPGVEPDAARLGARNSLVRRWRAQRGDELTEAERFALVDETCRISRPHCATLFAQWSLESPHSPLRSRALALARRRAHLAPALAPPVLAGLEALFGADATAGREPSYELARDLTRVFARFYHHAAPFDAEAVQGAWRRCAAVDRRCAAELEPLSRLGHRPPRPGEYAAF